MSHDDTVKDPIFASLKSITQLPFSPSKNGDRLDDSVVGTAESPSTEEGKGKKSSVAGTG